MVDNYRLSRGARGSFSCLNNLESPSLPSQSRSQCGSPNSSSKMLMKKLRAIDFALAETVLYLDVYPHSKPALEYYHKLICERESIVDDLAQSGIAITCRDNVSMSDWNWTNSPWPWHPDAN